MDKRADKLGQYPTTLIQWIITNWLDEQDQRALEKKQGLVLPEGSHNADSDQTGRS